MDAKPPSDTGFSLVETLVSIAIIGVVMTALTTFFVSATATLNKQQGTQTAVQLAHHGVELVKSLPGASIVSGRSAKDVVQQFTTDRVPGLDITGLLTTMKPAADPTLGLLDASVNPVLPVRPEALMFNGLAYDRHWFIGSCQMPLGELIPAVDQVCGLSVSSGTVATFYRVVIAITWDNDRACAKSGGVCAYVTQTLVTAAPADPIFNPAVTVTPPLPNNPGAQAGEVTVPITPFTLTAASSYPPMKWAAVNLPAGVTISDSGIVTGTPTSPGTYEVRIEVTDQAATNDAVFSWTVAALPAAAPVDQTFEAGEAASYTVPLSGGTGPFTWSATGLPSGLTISPTTGVITGSSTASGAASSATVTVKVIDFYKKQSSVAFKWNTKVVVQYPTEGDPIAMTRGVAYSGSTGAIGGRGPYTWTAANLPPGLVLSTAGVLSGTVNGATRYLVTLTVTDSNGVSNTAVVPVNITSSGSQLRVVAPTMTAPDKTGTRGTAITPQSSTSSGGNMPHTWTATNLPPGLVLNATTGLITGTPNTAGAYTVTLRVTDRTGATALFMFVWTIS